MTVETSAALRSGSTPAGILPPSSAMVHRRVVATAEAISAIVDQRPHFSDARLHGCIALPLANMLLAGTACARPLLIAEFDALAQATSADILVVRFDALHGTTFDIKLRYQRSWLRRYLAEETDDGLRLMPGAGAGPVVKATARGMEVRPARTPFADPIDVAAAAFSSLCEA